jgi:hypothetical protein
MLQHVTRSRGWNIIERVNGNVGNEIELGMKIPTIKSRMLQVSQKQKDRTLMFIDQRRVSWNAQGSARLSRADC